MFNFARYIQICEMLQTYKSISSKIFRVFIMGVIAFALSACDPDRTYYDDYYYEPGYTTNFVGSWELVSINSTYIHPEEYTTYQLWQNGSGDYGFYYRGRWYSEPLSWTLSNDGYHATMLYINSSQGRFTYEVTYISPSTMILLDVDTNNQLEYQRF